MHGDGDAEGKRQPRADRELSPGCKRVRLYRCQRTRTPRLPPRAGVGFKSEHFRDIEESAPDVGFFEVHAENYMGAGGPPHPRLAAPHGLSAVDPWRRPVDRRGAAARSRASSPRESPDRSLRAGRVLGTSRLVDARHMLPQRPAAAALQRKTLARRRPCRRDPGGARPAACCSKIPRPTCASVDRTIPRSNSCRGRAPHRLRAAARRQQRLRLRGQPRLRRPSAYIDAFPMRHVGGDPSRRICRGRGRGRSAPADRRALLAGLATPSGRSTSAPCRAAGRSPTLIEWDNDVPTWPILMAEATRAESFLEKRRTGRAGQLAIGGSS